MQAQSENKRHLWRRRALTAAIASLAGIAGQSGAFEIDTGNADLEVRWDNTLRYNLGVRAQGQDAAILANPNLDDGDRNFSNGSLVTNRLDVLSEFDLVYRKKYGVRFSAALWYDNAYGSLDNDSIATSNTLASGLPALGLSPFTKRYAKGASGEWLDAFAFANFDVAGVPVSVKAGQHTVYWGESLLLGGAIHGISYAQNSLDVWKGLATPGASAKELFRPRGGLTVQAQPTNDFAIAGQWFYNWQAVRIPESGSYLTINDGYLYGADSIITGANPLFGVVPGAPALSRLWNANRIKDSRYSGSLGDFGISARWSPEWLDGTLGFYARNATDIAPQLVVTPGVAPLPAPVCGAVGGVVVGPNACLINPNATNPADLAQKGRVGTYQYAYGNDIQMYGVSLSKNISGVSVGAELSWRRNMPLLSNPVTALPAPLVDPAQGQVATGAVASNGDTPGARGNTMHGLLNGIVVIPKTALFDTASVAAELTWMQWLSVTQNEAVFKGGASYVNPDGSSPIDKVTKNFVGLGINFAPQWFQVFPGVDVTLPVNWSQGLSGNSAVLLGGARGAGSWSAGLTFDIFQKYNVALLYTGYYGDYSTDPATGALTVANGPNASLSDRGFVSLTLKATF